MARSRTRHHEWIDSHMHLPPRHQGHPLPIRASYLRSHVERCPTTKPKPQSACPVHKKLELPTHEPWGCCGRLGFDPSPSSSSRGGVFLKTPRRPQQQHHQPTQPRHEARTHGCGTGTGTHARTRGTTEQTRANSPVNPGSPSYNINNISQHNPGTRGTHARQQDAR